MNKTSSRGIPQIAIGAIWERNSLESNSRYPDYYRYRTGFIAS
ncbi:hypothetical protein [Pleomorphovibrio marinus]|nr:hypothetical protein [Pleomorphovibrio marinus]